MNTGHSPQEDIKFCECGCGKPAPIAKRTRSSFGHVKGQPMRFVLGHHSRPVRENPNIAEIPPSTKAIPLTQGKVAIVDAADYEWLMQWPWYAHKDKNTYYARRNETSADGRRRGILMHRAILGVDGSQEIIDHKDGDGLNNRRANLRSASVGKNNYNATIRKDNKTGMKGVSWSGRYRTWHAHIRKDNRQIHLGTFDCLLEAALAYDDAAVALFGDYARLNFPHYSHKDNLSFKIEHDKAMAGAHE